MNHKNKLFLTLFISLLSNNSQASLITKITHTIKPKLDNFHLKLKIDGNFHKGDKFILQNGIQNLGTILHGKGNANLKTSIIKNTNNYNINFELLKSCTNIYYLLTMRNEDGNQSLINYNIENPNLCIIDDSKLFNLKNQSDDLIQEVKFDFDCAKDDNIKKEIKDLNDTITVLEKNLTKKQNKFFNKLGCVDIRK